MELDGRTALVTGAAGAIGAGVARDLCARGARVFVTDLDANAVARTASEVGQAGECAGQAGNVTDEASVQSVVASAMAFGGGAVDILVNVAGVVGQGLVEEITVEEWERIFAVNCRGTFLTCKHVVPGMKARGWGRIVNFSSKSGKTGSALMSHYSAAKAAVIGFTQALAYELADSGINVNCVCPGITDHTGVWSAVSAGYIENLGKSREEVIKRFTAKIPLRRLASIADVVAVTGFLCSSGADYMTGQAINITGGREMH